MLSSREWTYRYQKIANNHVMAILDWCQIGHKCVVLLLLPVCHTFYFHDFSGTVHMRLFVYFYGLPSVLWCCWLGGRKGIRPVKKTELWGAGMVICLEWGADLHMSQLMPLPLTVSCFSKIQIGFTFVVPTHLGSPGQRAVKRVCVCVCVCVCHLLCGY